MRVRTSCKFRDYEPVLDSPDAFLKGQEGKRITKEPEVDGAWQRTKQCKQFLRGIEVGNVLFTLGDRSRSSGMLQEVCLVDAW